MVTPPLHIIQVASFLIEKDRILLSRQRYPAIKLSIIAGDQSLAENIAFDWNITEYKNRTLNIQLNFTKAVYVSTNHQIEILKLEFL